ncbi:MAG: hypothetical protein AB1478_11515, partial [Nitrospirota bacterium]
MGSTEGVLIKLPDDSTFLEEIKKMRQIEQLIKRKGSIQHSDSIQKIIDGKNSEIQRIKGRVRTLIEDAIRHSTVYLHGSLVNIKGGNGKDIIGNAIHNMVENVYSKVVYITNHITYAEDIQTILNANDMELFNQEEWKGNKLAEDDVKSFIESHYSRLLKTTVKMVKDKYGKKPYGWSELDMAGIIASLFAKGLLRIKYNQEYVRNKKDILDYLIKKDYGEKVLIEPKPVISIDTITRIKKIMMDAFGSASLPDDTEGLFNKTKEVISGFRKELEGYKVLYYGKSYPGKDLVEDGLKLLDKILSINEDSQFFQTVITNKDNLLDLSEDIEPVRSFFKTQVSIFDKNLEEYKRFVNDKSYLNEEAKKNLEEMNRIFNMKEPYKEIKNLPLLAEGIKKEHSKILEDYRKAVIDKIRLVIDDIKEILERNKSYINSSFAESIISYYTRQVKEVEAVNDCVKLKALTVEVDEWKSVSLNQIDAEVEKHK